MGDFDETKHLRDSNGRFTSGAAGFVAKHTGKLPKLEGYSKPTSSLIRRRIAVQSIRTRSSTKRA